VEKRDSHHKKSDGAVQKCFAFGKIKKAEVFALPLFLMLA
jgi:hypothetical protein